MTSSIWPDSFSDNLSNCLTSLLDGFQHHHFFGSFWRDWYEGFLKGKPLDWELQRRVALMPDEDWDAGPNVVATRIAEIRARFELEQRIVELEQARDAAQATASRLGMGGKNPPEPRDDDQEIGREVTIIWSCIEELKTEVTSQTPDKGRVSDIVRTLCHGLKMILK
jgi:hypothetical protein